LDHYRVTILRQDSESPVAEATVKLRIGKSTEHWVAEGDGPVNALDNALRLALRAHYPQVEKVHLVDYKVRVINSSDETAAAVRVTIESRRQTSDGSKENFGTIGVSANVIDASWQALVDAYEYHLIHVAEGQG
jgi:2-isopropylmalate synthase